MPFAIAPYGKTPSGQAVDLITLTNAIGMTARLTNYGAILVGLTAPDRDGEFADVTLGYDDLAGWVDDTSYMGATVGRVGNRIANARFELAGHAYPLFVNQPAGHHLHGGQVGFNKRVWRHEAFSTPSESGVVFRYVSPDGEEGYPGTLDCAVTYTLTDACELKIDFAATTDATTLVNLVHHTYWNLSGRPDTTIEDYVLQLHSDFWIPTDSDGIPSGEVSAVADTPMDFSAPHRIGDRLRAAPGGGYDHNWVLRQREGHLGLVAVVYDPASGRRMELYTDQTGVQFYSSLFLGPQVVGKGGVPNRQFGAFCLETQRWPDGIHHPHFPSTILQPGELYRHRMIHRFSI